MQATVFPTPVPPRRRLRIGCVGYLNAKPLIYGLDNADGIELSLEIPAKLIDGMRDERFDVALLPIIDYQRLNHVRMLTAGGIGCDGPTLTVRIFSHVPIDRIKNLFCDVHSHTSVALARVILAEQYRQRPEFIAFEHSRQSPQVEAMLLIGDKVVCDDPVGYPHQLDLGQAWKELTGLPFVFAAWVARDDANLGGLQTQLEQAKSRGMAHLDQIVQRDAIPRGWPAGLALRYMTEFLKYDIGPRQIEAIRLFHQLAAKHGMIESPRELVFSEDNSTSPTSSQVTDGKFPSRL